jgi:hypothetical protein
MTEGLYAFGIIILILGLIMIGIHLLPNDMLGNCPRCRTALDLVPYYEWGQFSGFWLSCPACNYGRPVGEKDE